MIFLVEKLAPELGHATGKYQYWVAEALQGDAQTAEEFSLRRLKGEGEALFYEYIVAKELTENLAAEGNNMVFEFYKNGFPLWSDNQDPVLTTGEKPVELSGRESKQHVEYIKNIIESILTNTAYQDIQNRAAFDMTDAFVKIGNINAMMIPSGQPEGIFKLTYDELNKIVFLGDQKLLDAYREAMQAYQVFFGIKQCN